MRCVVYIFLLALGAAVVLGCDGGRTRGWAGESPPKPVARVDAVELWAAPPAAINWDEVPGPDGVQVRLYLYRVEDPEPVLVDGSVEFRLYAGRVRPDVAPAPEPLKVWRLTAEDLAVRRIRSLVGWGYAARLGWGGEMPKAPAVTVQAIYHPPEGPPVASAPLSIALPTLRQPGPIRSVLGAPPASARPPSGGPTGEAPAETSREGPAEAAGEGSTEAAAETPGEGAAGAPAAGPAEKGKADGPAPAGDPRPPDSSAPQG